MTDFDLAEFLPYQLAVAAARVSRALAERYRREHGISIPEWRVLAHLAQADAVSVREIHARVDMDKSKVSRAAARLEEAGLIDKRTSVSDRRLVELRLAPKGRRLMAQLVPLALAFETELIAALGEDAMALRRALRQLDRLGPGSSEAED